MLMSLLNFHKNHHTHPSYLSFLKGSIGMMLNPEGTQSVFEMEDGLLKSESTQELLRFTSKDPTVDAMIKERYLQPVPDTASLGKLPKNTLTRLATSTFIISTRWDLTPITTERSTYRMTSTM